MTYKEFQDYFYSYITSLREYYNVKWPQETVESFIAPTEAAFQILWEDYVNLFGECFIRTTFPRFEFDQETVEYFNFILRSYSIEYKQNCKEFKIVCYSKSTHESLWQIFLNTQDLGSLYNYFINRLLIDSEFYVNENMYSVGIETKIDN